MLSAGRRWCVRVGFVVDKVALQRVFFHGLWNFHFVTVHQRSTLVFPSPTIEGRYIIFAVDKVIE